MPLPDQAPASGHRTLILPLGGLVAAVVLVYGGVIGHEFTLDSVPLVRESARVRDFDVGGILANDYWGLDEEALRRETRPGLYRPLTLLWLSALLQATSSKDLAENRSSWINAGNLLLHAAGVVLRFLLIRALLGRRPRRDLYAFLGALFLAVHPVSAEAVATQVGASEGLAVALSSASLLLYLRWLRQGGTRPLLLHLLLLFLALMAKETAVSVPFLALLMSWAPERHRLRTAFRKALPAGGVLLGWMALRWLVLGRIVGVSDPTYHGFSLLPRLATALAVIGSYDLRAIFWPTSLHPSPTLQDIAPALGLLDPRALLGLATVLATGAGTFWLRRRQPAVAMGLGWMGLGLLPVSNLVFLIGALAATRFLYFPLTGLGLVLAAGLGALCQRRGGAAALGWCLWAWFILPSLILGSQEAGVWKDDRTLFETTVERYPQGGWGLYNLGNSRNEEGRLGEALQCFEGAADTSRSTIPGSAGSVSEDLLDLAFQAAMNAAGVHALRLDEAARNRDPTGQRRHLAGAEQRFAQAEAVAREGLALGSGTTAWEACLAEALVCRAQARMWSLPDRGTNPDSFRRKLGEVREFLDEAVHQHPNSLRARFVAIDLLRLERGAEEAARALAGLHEEVRGRMARDPVARLVARAYARVLADAGRGDQAAKVILEALLPAGEAEPPDALLDPGLTALRSADPALRVLGVRALERWLLRAGPRSPARALEVEARLREARRAR